MGNRNKEMTALKIEMMKHKSSKLRDLNKKKGIKIEEIMEIETKLDKLNFQQQQIIQIKYFREIFVSHFKTQKILYLTEDLKVDELKQMI